MVKRLISVFIVVLLVFSSISVTSLAAGTDNSGVDYEKLELYFAESLKNNIREIDVSSYNLKYSGDNDPIFHKIGDIIDGIRFKYPLLFNLKNSGIEVVRNTSNILGINVNYRYTADEYKSRLFLFEMRADELLKGIKGNNNLTDVQKALLIHDRLIVNCQYMRTNTVDSDSLAYTSYGALINGEAYCQGYALAYMYLLDEVGIKNYFCPSDQLGHAWNILELNGKLYHVDVTWDDPLKDISGRVSHEHFLRSTEAFSKTHNAGDYDKTPTDITYDDYFWQDSDTEFQLIGNDVYYFDNIEGKLKKWSVESEDEVLLDLSDTVNTWEANETNYWFGDFTRLASDGENLYYSLKDRICKYDLTEKKSEDIYIPTLPQSDKSTFYRIYGLTYANNYLIYNYYYSPEYTGLNHYKEDFQNRYKVLTSSFKTIELIDGELCYLKDGEVQTGFTGIEEMENGVRYFIRNGIVNVLENTLVEHNGELYHTNYGIVDLNEPPMIVPYNDGKLYYVNGGKNDKNFTGIVQYDEILWYVRKGIVIVSNEPTIVNYKGVNYYVKGGVVDTEDSGVYKSTLDGRIWDVKDGIATLHTVHSGGTATCTKKAVCICGTEYGNINPNNHIYSSILSGKCDTCGKVRYNGLIGINEIWYYYNNGVLDKSNTILKCNGLLYHVKDGKWNKNEAATLIKYGSTWYYFVGGINNTSNTLVKYNGTWYHVKDGKYNPSESATLVKYNGTWYYCNKGVLDNKSNTMVKYSGAWYHVKGGTYNPKETATLVKYNGTWYYCNKGVLDNKSNTMVKYLGAWYHVKGGSYNPKEEATLVKYGGTWYYCNKGVLNKSNTLVNYGGTWYHVNGGTYNPKETATLVKYNGIWYYCNKGVLNKSNTLVNYGGAWYHVNGGTYNPKEGATLVKYGGTWYYCNAGKVNFNYTGNVKYGGKTYKVQKGIKK